MNNTYENLLLFLKALSSPIIALFNKIFILLQSFPFVILLIVLIFRKEIKEKIAKITEAIIAGNKFLFDKGDISFEEVIKKKKPASTPMRNKILNTLWTKQVNAFPDFSRVWTFRINANSPEFMAFLEEGNRLLGEGLIGETDQGQFHLTQTGFQHCKKHYLEFGTDQWWPNDTINEKHLGKVLENT